MDVSLSVTFLNSLFMAPSAVLCLSLSVACKLNPFFSVAGNRDISSKENHIQCHCFSDLINCPLNDKEECDLFSLKGLYSFFM